MSFQTDKHFALSLDQRDPLSKFRELFYIDDPSLTYLDGNSLGRLPKASLEKSEQLIRQDWGNGLICSWNKGWLYAPERIGEKISQLLGTKPGEIIIADATSINLFKLVIAALQYQTGRTKIITDNLNFPSDIYILQGAIDFQGSKHELEIIPSIDDIHGPVDAIIDSLSEETALLSLSHTTFKSGYTYDMQLLTKEAHKKGVLVLWDLSHSAGAVPIDLKTSNVDLAVGCTYKYLNGGPGSPAYLYVRQDLQADLKNPIPGWMGRADMFGFQLDYQPDPTLRKMLTSSPPIISLSLIEPGVDMILEAGIKNIRAKSMEQTEFMVNLWQALLKPVGFSLNSPTDPSQRGSHISIGHEEGLRIDLSLINDMNVIPDFRTPDNIRLGFAPLYTTFEEIHHAAFCLTEIVTNNLYRKYDHATPAVT